MAHGLLYECSACDFHFLGGYDPMNPQVSVVCVACFAQYLFPIRRGHSPESGEMLELHEFKIEEVNRRRGRRKHETVRRFVLNPTGQKVRVVMPSPASEMQYANLDALECTACGAVGTLSLSLDLPNGAPCRRCHSGIMRSEWI